MATLSLVGYHTEMQGTFPPAKVEFYFWRTQLNPVVFQEALYFFASQGWVSGIVKPWALNSVFFSGEGEILITARMAYSISALVDKLSDFDPSRLFNVDKKGLFFKTSTLLTYASSIKHIRSV